MPIRTWRTWFADRLSAQTGQPDELRVGLPRALNVWSTHRFWIGLLAAVGIDPRNIVFSSETSEAQGRRFGRGREAVDCCYPVKCLNGHYGELLFGLKNRIDVLLSPLIHSLPSRLHPHVADSQSCPRVMAGPESIRGGFTKESELFAELGILYLAPLVSLAEPELVPKQLSGALRQILPGLRRSDVHRAVTQGYAELDLFDRSMRRETRQILDHCARQGTAAILVLARPYHMDPGIGHAIEADLQAAGYPIVWCQYLPLDADLLDWLFGADVARGDIRSPLDIRDVWPSSYSANTNEIVWAAKFAARYPWISCVIRLTSYECGMDQPTYTPVKEILERSGTLYFAFQDLDATKPAGSLRIRIETIAHYLALRSADIIRAKLARLDPGRRVPPALFE